MKKPLIKVQKTNLSHPKTNNSRRQFLKMGGLAVAGSSLLLYGCSDDDDDMEPMPGEVFDLGSGDVGILNYAYALEQLEAAFYTNVLDGSYWMNANAEEKKILEDLYKHEVIHREFFKAAITGAAGAAKTLPELEFDFSSVNFGDRDSVLQTAQILEDTGVSAYNGAGSLLVTPDYLTLAGKIVSVEARHASAIRSIYLSDDTAFAGDDVIDANGLDPAVDPATILAAVGSTGFVKTAFTANNLPTGA
ncbi:ferritin-like domain-containing protein [Gillisia sp. M10.2A]|uniref:Ferritin-like domain-containing protein n=1 Tax=Gillisia lutea TaxID=2909668 RepID=A0ABS9EGT0_9FLAO|nr:ferritin-like domain-containing protein [Gillisia lutea]MCF4101349.1 ferritin-like domain-containing protein [Gillisia lutea]